MSKKILLQDVVPDIEKYWDYAKNKGIELSTLAASASIKVWTYCPICGTSVLRNVRYTWTKDDLGIGYVICCRTCGKRGKSNSLVELCPDIKNYWDYDNNEHNPDYYTISSGKKVFVKCPRCGKNMLRAICDMIKKTAYGSYRIASCLDCSRSIDRFAKSKKESNIAKWCPDIDKYWDYEANDCLPEDIIRSSSKKVYIHCPACNKLLYRAVHNSFVRTGDDFLAVMLCQKCAAQKSNRAKGLQQSGHILDTCSEIKEWWDYETNALLPSDVSNGSHYKAHLVCPACNSTYTRDLHSVISLHTDGKYHIVACPNCGYSSSKGDPEDNLVKLVPNIVYWWDYEANKPFRPEQFSRGSQFSAYLTCPDCGMRLYTGIHSLLKTLDDGTVIIRHEGRCRKFRAQKNDNNLVKCYPEITNWWAYKKNAPHKPEDFSTGSRLSAYFICPNCGTETYRRISDAFTLKDNGKPYILDCPYCAGTKVIPGVNSLKALYPSIAAECVSNVNTDRISPDAYTSLDWKCPTCNGVYSSVVSLRVKGNGCPYCNDIHVLTGFNDLATIEPELAKEWSAKNDFGPESIRRTKHLAVIWHCPTCHGEYSYPVDNRYVGDDSCPYCNERKALPGFNDLATIEPELAKEWSASNTRTPDSVLRTSNFLAIWHCPACHGEYSYLVSKRHVGDDSCPYCNERKALPGFNDLATIEPELAREWSASNTKTPDSVLRTSKFFAIWHCPTCHGEYSYPVADRHVGDDSCPYCNERKALPGFNDLATIDPELTIEWSASNTRTPDSVLRTSNFLAIWHCPTCHGEYSYPVSKRHVGDDSCPYCNERKALPGFNDLATIEPELAKEWSASNTRSPDSILRTSKFFAIWHCPTCHGEYSYPVADRYVGDDSCPYCNDRKALPGFNSFKVKYPNIMEKEWYWMANIVLGVDPDNFLDSSSQQAWFECPICHYQYLMSLKKRAMKEKRHQNPCPKCNGRRHMIPYHYNI